MKIVSSILRMRNPQDMFTTVDLAIIDVYRGKSSSPRLELPAT